MIDWHEVWLFVRWRVIGWERVSYWLIYLSWVLWAAGGAFLHWAISKAIAARRARLAGRAGSGG